MVPAERLFKPELDDDQVDEALHKIFGTDKWGEIKPKSEQERVLLAALCRRTQYLMRTLQALDFVIEEMAAYNESDYADRLQEIRDLDVIITTIPG